jgi:hypothetical protein
VVTRKSPAASFNDKAKRWDIDELELPRHLSRIHPEPGGTAWKQRFLGVFRPCSSYTRWYDGVLSDLSAVEAARSQFFSYLRREGQAPLQRLFQHNSKG